MFSNRFAVDLNLPELPFLEKFPTLEINNAWDSVKIPLEIINPKYKIFLNSKGIDIYDNCMLFGTREKSKSLLHIDSDQGTHDLCYINYAYGSSSHEMCWFDTNNEKNTAIDIQESFLKIFDDNKNYQELCRHTVKFPSLVKIGYAHQIFNYDIKPRFCVSIAVIESSRSSTSINGYDGIDFDWATNQFKDYII